ncbi:MAG: zinc ribbon domain-containing protein [Deltaproteobacteria bacterium]|nr:zinc ribbon domain-containing protein [Deltaproteobacteria bacterium]
MKCSKCQFELPEGAKFCPKCGNRMKPSPPAAATGPVTAPAADTATTQKDLARASTEPAAVPSAPPAAGAAATGGPGAMSFYPADLDRALTMAIKKTKTRPTKRRMADVAAYYAVGDELGIARPEMEAALHAVALEKVKGVGASPTAMFFRSPRINTIYNALRIVEPKSRKERIKLYVLAAVAIALVVTTVVLAGVAWRQSGIRKQRQAELDRQRLEAMSLPASLPEQVLGTIDRAAFNAAVASFSPKLQGCVSSALKEPLAAATTFRVSARIDLEGKLSEIKVRDPLANEVLSSCIEKEVAAHPFPKAEKAPVEIEFSSTAEPPAAKGAPAPSR